MDKELRQAIKARALRIMATDPKLAPANAVRRAADSIMAEKRDPILAYNDKRLHAQLCFVMAQRDLSERRPETLRDRRCRANKTDRRVYAGRESLTADPRVRFPHYVIVGAATARGYVEKGSMARTIKAAATNGEKAAKAAADRAERMRHLPAAPTIAGMGASIHTD